MTIREATPADVAEIHAMILELAAYERLAEHVVCTPADLEAALFGPERAAQASLAVDGPRVVGYALWFPTFSTFLGRAGIWLEDLYVCEQDRHQGHGRALITDLRERTTGRVEWNVLDWNERSIAFYDSLGARPLRGWTTYQWLPDYPIPPLGM